MSTWKANTTRWHTVRAVVEDTEPVTLVGDNVDLGEGGLGAGSNGLINNSSALTLEKSKNELFAYRINTLTYDAIDEERIGSWRCENAAITISGQELGDDVVR